MNTCDTQDSPRIYILGLGLPVFTDSRPVQTLPEAHPLLCQAERIIGGKEQLAAVAHLPAEKIPVGADTASLYARLEEGREAGLRQVVLCSGDPLFFGLGARLAERFGPEAVRVLPGLSSLQAAAAFLGKAWERMHSASLHGRPSRLALAHALLRTRADGGPTFLLTDAASNPAAVAAFMRERGYGNYRLHVMGNLHLCPGKETDPCSGPRIEAEYYVSLRAEEALDLPPLSPAHPLQVVMVIEQDGREQAGQAFGLADDDLEADGNLLTKAPVRAAGLAALGIEAGHTVWDLGAGSGAVSIEAARLACCGQVFAVEAREERVRLIARNRQRFGAANLEIIHGTLPEALEPCLAASPRPQRIFIGGGLNAQGARPLLEKAWEALLPGGRLQIHCVLLSSLALARQCLAEKGAATDIACIQASAGVPLAGDCRLQALNPVFLITARKA